MPVPDRRRAARLAVTIPTVVEAIGARADTLHPNVARVVERVLPAAEAVGRRFPAVIRDLSTNGAFIAGGPLPLLARVQFTFPLEGHGQVDALGWVMWRRVADCEVPVEGGAAIRLPAGFGVLFEAIPLETRQAIAQLLERR